MPRKCTFCPPLAASCFMFTRSTTSCVLAPALSHTCHTDTEVQVPEMHSFKEDHIPPYGTVLWIRIRMDPHHFGNLDPHPDSDPHKIKFRIRIRIKVISWIRNRSGSASIWRWQAKMYGIWAYSSIFSRVWAFIWKLGSGSRSASNKKIRIRIATKWSGSTTLPPYRYEIPNR